MTGPTVFHLREPLIRLVNQTILILSICCLLLPTVLGNLKFLLNKDPELLVLLLKLQPMLKCIKDSQ